MKIKFYGVRGSYPVPGTNTTRYGGNTTCVTFTKEHNGTIHRLIIDSGTGAIQLGRDIVANHFQNREALNLDVLFTHLHPDHTQGFPFFAPNYFPQCKVNLYGMKALKQHVGKIIAKSMLPPNFPIEYKDLKSTRIHHELKDGQTIEFGKDADGNNTTGEYHHVLQIFEVKVMQAFSPSHPQQGALYFRVKDCETQKSVACIWDNESKIGGDKAVINFAKDADVMIHDTQYTSEEYVSDKMIVQGFGHSTYDMALDNAQQAGVKKLMCLHYNPAHTDQKLDEIAAGIKQNGVVVAFAREGMEIEV